jgi:GNAT superfamily N-acetyltransferase
MQIREATPDDNGELIALQAKCPQGTSLVVSTVNTPDFFARAKAYESYKIYVAYEEDTIIGSAACTMRESVVNDRTCRVGYEFQYFTSPDRRGKGVAKVLHGHIENYLTGQSVVLSYILIMEGNLPARRLFESQNFRLHRTLVMTVLPVYEEMDMGAKGKIRPMRSDDLPIVAELLNNTWQGHDLYVPTSAEALARFVNRTPAYSLTNTVVLEDQGEILASLGVWDWSQIARITVKSLSSRLRMTGMLVDVIGYFRPVPRLPKAGTTLRQWCLTPIAFSAPEHLRPLFRYLNNRAVEMGIEQIFCLCERGHPLLTGMKGLFRRNVAMHLYVKPLQQSGTIGPKPVFIDGIDL